MMTLREEEERLLRRGPPGEWTRSEEERGARCWSEAKRGPRRLLVIGGEERWCPTLGRGTRPATPPPALIPSSETILPSPSRVEGGGWRVSDRRSNIFFQSYDDYLF